MIFTTEIAAGEDVVGQERLVLTGSSRVGGRVTLVSFNQLVMDVNFGNPSDLPRRGELTINTIAAQKALSHQTQALDAVVYDRAVSERLKAVILDPTAALPALPVADVVPTDEDLDGEKKEVLSRALGVQDILAIEGPPGTGKTKLIAEIVVQWLRLNPTHRIMLSSQTHIALDNVLERVAAMDPSVESDPHRQSRRTQNFRGQQEAPAGKAHRGLDRSSEERLRTRNGEVGRASRRGPDDRQAGMSVERLIQLLRRQEELRTSIDERLSRRQSVEEGLPDEGQLGGSEEAEEETTQIDSEVGELRTELKEAIEQERVLRDAMRSMGGYAGELADSNDHAELADWALHFLSADPKIEACRARLTMLEDWHLRVGRSSDFNAAVLSSAQVIAGTCVGVAGVKGMARGGLRSLHHRRSVQGHSDRDTGAYGRSRKWILVGDPNQLPPFFEQIGDDLLAQFDDREIKATLLDRMLNPQDGLPKECRAELRNQYRMISP